MLSPWSMWITLSALTIRTGTKRAIRYYVSSRPCWRSTLLENAFVMEAKNLPSSARIPTLNGSAKAWIRCESISMKTHSLFAQKIVPAKQPIALKNDADAPLQRTRPAYRSVSALPGQTRKVNPRKPLSIAPTRHSTERRPLGETVYALRADHSRTLRARCSNVML